MPSELNFRYREPTYSFLWILDAPFLYKNNADEYVRFVDSIVKAFVPNEVKDPELLQLVTTPTAFTFKVVLQI